MKILMATMGLDIGGAETHIVELARELVREGHEVVVASNGGVYVPELEKSGIRHVKVPLHTRNPFSMVKGLFIMRREIRRERPDIVHAHARIPAFVCGILQKLMGFPMVTTAHWVFDPGFILRYLTNWGDRTIAVSDDIVKYLTDNYPIDREKITVTINGIDTEKFSPAVSGENVRREFNIPVDALMVSHVSRLDEDRALAADTLLKIAPTLAQRVSQVRILIAGGGDRYEELSRRADEINLKIGYRCILMAGSRTDINEICAAGNVFVGVSRAALEAMAVARPVVVAGNEGYMGLFDEDKLQEGIDGNFCCRGLPGITRQALLDDVTTALTLEAQDYDRLAAYGRSVVCEHYSVRRMAADALEAYGRAVPPRRVALSGYYGFNNFGDEAILESLCRAIHGTDPEIEIVVLSKDPAFTEENHDCRAVQRFSPFAVWRTLRRCELLVSGGGSLLQDNTSTRSLLYYLSVIWLAHRLGKKTMLYANGVGPVRKPANRRRVRKIVELADSVVLRDPDSIAELRDMGVTRPDLIESADPVYTMPAPSHSAAQRELSIIGVEGPFVTVAVRPIRDAPDYIERFAALCDGIYERYSFKIVLIPMQPRFDEPVCWEVKEAMRNPATVLSGSYTPLDVMGIIGEGRIALAMRLHALIFAACTCTPTLGFDYDPKVGSCLAMLRMPAVGSIADMDVDKLLEAVDVMLTHRDELVDSLRDSVDRVRTMALRANRELARLLDSDGHPEEPEEEADGGDTDNGEGPAPAPSDSGEAEYTEETGPEEERNDAGAAAGTEEAEPFSSLTDFAEFEIIHGIAPDETDGGKAGDEIKGKE